MKPWSMQGVEGVYRFLQKTWRLVVDEETGELAAAIQDAEPDEETVRLLHQTIRKVGSDVETFGFNTAISAMMIFVNHLVKQEVRSRSVVESFVLLVARSRRTLPKSFGNAWVTARASLTSLGRSMRPHLPKTSRSSCRFRLMARSGTGSLCPPIWTKSRSKRRRLPTRR